MTSQLLKLEDRVLASPTLPLPPTSILGYIFLQIDTDNATKSIHPLLSFLSCSLGLFLFASKNEDKELGEKEEEFEMRARFKLS